MAVLNFVRAGHGRGVYGSWFFPVYKKERVLTGATIYCFMSLRFRRSLRIAPGVASTSGCMWGSDSGIILSGRLEMTVDSERRILGPGDAYYFESRRPHRFRCVGAKACEVISACTPPTF